MHCLLRAFASSWHSWFRPLRVIGDSDLSALRQPLIAAAGKLHAHFHAGDRVQQDHVILAGLLHPVVLENGIAALHDKGLTVLGQEQVAVLLVQIAVEPELRGRPAPVSAAISSGVFTGTAGGGGPTGAGAGFGLGARVGHPEDIPRHAGELSSLRASRMSGSVPPDGDVTPLRRGDEAVVPGG